MITYETPSWLLNSAPTWPDPKLWHLPRSLSWLLRRLKQQQQHLTLMQTVESLLRDHEQGLAGHHRLERLAGVNDWSPVTLRRCLLNLRGRCDLQFLPQELGSVAPWRWLDLADPSEPEYDETDPSVGLDAATRIDVRKLAGGLEGLELRGALVHGLEVRVFLKNAPTRPSALFEEAGFTRDMVRYLEDCAATGRWFPRPLTVQLVEPFDTDGPILRCTVWSWHTHRSASKGVSGTYHLDHLSPACWELSPANRSHHRDREAFR